MGRDAFQGTRGSNRALAVKKQYEDALREKFFDDFMAPVELIGLAGRGKLVRYSARSVSPPRGC
jgi:hypothetical protein